MGLLEVRKGTCFLFGCGSRGGRLSATLDVVVVVVVVRRWIPTVALFQKPGRIEMVGCG